MKNGQIANLVFEQVSSGKLLNEAKEIFREYQNSIETDLCFQNFEKELDSLPGKYALPKGRLYLAILNDEIIGSVALRPMEEKDLCEMKRLYVRPAFRGQKLGKLLAEKIILDAKEIGYTKMYLDTLIKLPEAVSLYKKLGFKVCDSYCFNPLYGAIYMCLNLKFTN